MKKWIGLLLAALLGGWAMTLELDLNTGPDTPEADVRYTNLDPMPQAEASVSGMLKRYLFEPRVAARPDSTSLPVATLAADQVLADTGDTVYRLGHSTVLMVLDGALWLTDPVFSKRASPVQWAGPKRFHAPPIALDDLPPIDGVVISHNHYDHLDKWTIKRLHERVGHFLVPTGVGRTLIDWGVPAEKVQELGWWESATVGSVTLSATPAQHFSGRGLTDGNATLWASWVIATPERRVFFSGDSGYFSGFKAIGEAFGPFDLTLIETGAYDPNWPGVHMSPDQSLQAHRDLGGGHMMPIHNSTFDLAFHPWYEPLERLRQLTTQSGHRLATPIIGAPFSLERPDVTEAWWRPLMVAG